MATEARTVGKRAVRILLECFLVYMCFDEVNIFYLGTTQATGLGTGFGTASTTAGTGFDVATSTTTKPATFGISAAVTTSVATLSTATSTYVLVLNFTCKIITAHQQSCGKVVFSVVCVHGGGGGRPM